MLCGVLIALFRGGLIQKTATALLALGQPLVISAFELCIASIRSTLGGLLLMSLL
jgi:hypothetical protein